MPLNTALSPYRCPICGTSLKETDGTVTCETGHVFDFLDQRVIDFHHQDEDESAYSSEQAAEKNANAMAWLFATFGSDNSTLRQALVRRLDLSVGQRVLVTGAGTGEDLPFISAKIGRDGSIYAQDLSKQMLLSGLKTRNRSSEEEAQVHYSLCDATRLPFEDAVFDAAYHFGGLNEFPDKRAGINEMDRVVRDGGRVVFSDEGLAPWLRNTEYGSMIINNNPLCATDPSAIMSLLPDSVRQAELSWELGYYFYVVSFTVSKSPLPLNPHVAHKGVRGGTMYRRWHGAVEGIDPALRDALYKAAESRGISRVDLIETILQNGLDDLQ